MRVIGVICNNLEHSDFKYKIFVPWTNALVKGFKIPNLKIERVDGLGYDPETELNKLKKSHKGKFFPKPFVVSGYLLNIRKTYSQEFEAILKIDESD